MVCVGVVAVAPRASQLGHRSVLLRLVCAGLCVLQLGVGRAPGRVNPRSNVWLVGSDHRCLGRAVGQPGAARVASSARGACWFRTGHFMGVVAMFSSAGAAHGQLAPVATENLGLFWGFSFAFP